MPIQGNGHFPPDNSTSDNSPGQFTPWTFPLQLGQFPLPYRSKPNLKITYIHACTNVHVGTHAYIYTYMHIHIGTCTHVYTHTIHTCIHTLLYIHIFIHTYTLIYSHIY